LALAGGELVAGLFDGSDHSLAASLGEAATQDRDQLGLCIGAQLLGRVQDIGEGDELAHGVDLEVGDRSRHNVLSAPAGRKPGAEYDCPRLSISSKIAPAGRQ
jgi:hypothetical protein